MISDTRLLTLFASPLFLASPQHNTEWAFVYPKNGIWPKSASKLTNLYSVRTNAIPDFIGSWRSLKHLNIYHSTGFTSIPPELPGSLIYLSLDDNDVTAIPSSILRLASLTSLNLKGNEIASIPAGIERMTSLTQLLLHHNKITSIPTSLGTLTNLKTIFLWYNVVENLGPFAKGAACPGTEKKEGSKDATCDDKGGTDHGCVRLAGNHGVCKSNVTLNGTSVTTYLDGYNSNEVNVTFLDLSARRKLLGPKCSHLLTLFSRPSQSQVTRVCWGREWVITCL